MNIQTDVVLKIGEMTIDPNPENTDQMWPFLYGVAIGLQRLNTQLRAENTILLAIFDSSTNDIKSKL